MDKTKLLPPLVAYYNRLKAFLECDEQITTNLDQETNTITVLVDNPVKALAWREILPEKSSIGSVQFSIDIQSTKHGVDESVIVAAMTGNSAFSRFYHMYIPWEYIDRNFCYLNPQVIQFYNDNFGSPESLETWTAEGLAKEIFNIPDLSFCTEEIEKDDF